MILVERSTERSPRGWLRAGLASPLTARLLVLWLLGTVAFLPVKILPLPFNFEMVDAWVLLGLPLALLHLLMGPRRPFSPAYLLPMWLVLLSSFLSSFSAPSAMNSLVVILKESYLFLWFMVLAVLLPRLAPRQLRLVLSVWALVAALHGLLMVAQFISPELWRLTNELGGVTARMEGYRAAGLFICGKAGCANKAAYFQIVAFVPLLLSGFSRRVKVLLGLAIFTGLLTSGSMAATAAFFIGMAVTVLAAAVASNQLGLLFRFSFQAMVAGVLLAGLFYGAARANPRYAEHIERILIGRFDRSSGGRLSLWSRGIDALVEHNAFLWGVGPENFRVVDAAQTDNQLHNDTLAFLVERGLIGVLGLGLFAFIPARRALFALRHAGRSPLARYELAVFLGFLAATVVESITHQLFRTRELWLALAVLEAVYLQLRWAMLAERARPGLRGFASAARLPAAERKVEGHV